MWEGLDLVSKVMAEGLCHTALLHFSSYRRYSELRSRLLLEEWWDLLWSYKHTSAKEAARRKVEGARGKEGAAG